MRSLWMVGTALIAACGGGNDAVRLTLADANSPAPAGSELPQLARSPGGGMLLSWLESGPDSGRRFRMAVQREGIWSEARTIAEGRNILRFSADLYSVTAFPNGGIMANWEVAAAPGNPYASHMLVARSTDEGRTWSDPQVPHRDRSVSSHGFASTFASGADLGLVWLDGRNPDDPAIPPNGGSPSNTIGLYSTTVSAAGEVRADQMIDKVTCECCPTSAALAGSGPVVVYRGRSAPPAPGVQEGRDSVVRDIYLARLESGRWTAPHKVHADNWVYNGCPDNGPSVDARGDTLVVAWWTGAGGHRNVRVAFSFDAGNGFTDPIRGDDGDGEGQVTVALTQAGAVLGWLEGGTTRARWIGFDGVRGPTLVLGPAPTHARLARWLAEGDRVMAVWTEMAPGAAKQVRIGRLALNRGGD